MQYIIFISFVDEVLQDDQGQVEFLQGVITAFLRVQVLKKATLTQNNNHSSQKTKSPYLTTAFLPPHMFK